MNKQLIFSIFALMFLAGCINVSYNHEISADGTSSLEEVLDLGGYFEYIKSTGSAFGGAEQGFDPSQLSAFCAATNQQLTEGTSCRVEGTKVYLKKSFTSADGFYTFESSGGLFGGNYKVVVAKIPSKSFLKDSPPPAGGADDLTGGLGTSQTEDVDFTDKAKNAEAARGAVVIGMNMTYVVTMPAPVTKATTGKYQALINGNTATFNLLKVFEDSEPLVIEAEGGSGMLMVVVVVVVVLIVLALLWFFVFNKKPKA